LLKLGFLVRTGNDRVRPGLPLLGLGYAALSRQPMAELARQRMEEIALRFRGAMSLGTREGFEILYLQRVDGGPVIYPGLRPGSRVTLLASAMGWAYLAALPLGQRKEFLSSAKQHSPELYRRIHSRLEKAFRDFAQHGYIVNSGLIHPELSAIAFPVAVPGELPKAALSFGGLKSIFSIQRLERELAPQLKSLAKMLSITQC
jgi:DNA-binding IclR family transcriptional regulator